MSVFAICEEALVNMKVIYLRNEVFQKNAKDVSNEADSWA